MLYAWNIRQIVEDLVERTDDPDHHGMVTVFAIGILLARPSQEIAAKEIIPNLDYFHQRSGDHIDFYCGGYGRYWPKDGMHYNDAFEVGERQSYPWEFSPKAFSVFVEDLESETAWQYSGGVELLLLNCIQRGCGPFSIELDFSRVIALDLKRAVRDSAFVDVEHLFEDIVRIARSSTARVDVEMMSDELGLDSFLQGAREKLFGLLPLSIGPTVKRAAYFAVHDLAKDDDSLDY